MGRQKEFKVAKSFTLGIAECAWLAKHCHKEKIKASEFMNKLLRSKMLRDKQEEAKHAIIKQKGGTEFVKGGREEEKGKITEYKKTGEGTYKKTKTKIKKGKGWVGRRIKKQKTKTISAK